MTNSSTPNHQHNFNIGDLIIYKNNQLIAFNKPATLPVQMDQSEDKSLRDLAEIYCQTPVRLLHRIDRPASGVVLMAKNKKAAAILSEQFKNQTVEKIYLAIVKNAPNEKTGTLHNHLLRDGKKNLSKIVDASTKDAKEAILDYEAIGAIDRYTLLKITLKTGRHHQIRAQLAATGNPIKDDVKYGFRRGNRDRSIGLHAWKLSFDHPVTGDRETIIADWPDTSVWNAFKAVMKA